VRVGVLAALVVVLALVQPSVQQHEQFQQTSDTSGECGSF
jgi:hypothetical protein